MSNSVPEALKPETCPRIVRCMAHSHGFTILELIIASSIAMVVFGVGYLAISTTVSASNESAARIHETENVRLFFNMLERDLTSAFAGPSNIQKVRQQVPTYLPNPSPMVMTETVNSVSPQSDILQFYCRTENPSAGADDFGFVRYYINRADNTLCRQVKYDSTGNNFAGNFPDVFDPTLLTNVNNSDLALFDSIFKLTVTYQRWNPLTRQYDKEPAINPAVTNCDSLLLTIIFTDNYKQKRFDSFNAASDKASTSYQNNLNKNYRSYSKVFSIPASF